MRHVKRTLETIDRTIASCSSDPKFPSGMQRLERLRLQRDLYVAIEAAVIHMKRRRRRELAFFKGRRLVTKSFPGFNADRFGLIVENRFYSTGESRRGRLTLDRNGRLYLGDWTIYNPLALDCSLLELRHVLGRLRALVATPQPLPEPSPAH